jgi:GxxExxY protein
MLLSHSDLTEQVIGCAYEVYNNLGSGFLEKVYENALCIELKKHGLNIEAQKEIIVFYKGNQVGQYFADLVIEDLVVVELKAVDKIAAIHELQLKNYLKATELEVGLLINFGPKVEIRRKYVSSSVDD